MNHMLWCAGQLLKPGIPREVQGGLQLSLQQGQALRLPLWVPAGSQACELGVLL